MMTLKGQSHPTVSKWRIVGLVFGGVVVVITFLSYTRRAILIMESGDYERGLINLIALGVAFVALLAASAIAYVWVRKQRRAGAPQPDGLSAEL
jgi:hypothetical protein